MSQEADLYKACNSGFLVLWFWGEFSQKEALAVDLREREGSELLITYLAMVLAVRS